MKRKKKDIWQVSMFDEACMPIIDYWTTAEDIKNMLKNIPVKKDIKSIIDQSIWNELAKALEDIDLSREAWVNNIESIFGFVPFCFYETWVVDPRKTMDKFSREECVNFYLDLIDKKSWYRKYEELIPNIRKYFKVSLDRNEKDEWLRWYWDIVRSLPEECKEKCIISLNWWFDFGAMKNKFWLDSTKRIIDNILSGKPPFERYFVDSLLDKFFDNIWAKENIIKLESNKQDLMKFFDIIIFSFTNGWIDDQIEHLGTDMRDSYKKIFKMVHEAYNIKHKDWDLNTEDSVFYELDNWFDENYAYSYTQNLKDVIVSIINLMDDFSIDTPNDNFFNFLPAMFASYRKKWKNADISAVYKRNLINKYLRDGYYISVVHSRQEKQDRTNQFKLAIKDIDEISYDSWVITHILTWMRVGKQKFINFPPEQRKSRIKEWIEDREIMVMKINELKSFLVNENLSERFTVNLEREEIYHINNYEPISTATLLDGKKENRKAKLLKREDEINKENKAKMDENTIYIKAEESQSNYDIGYTTKRQSSSNDDDDLPF